MVSAHLSEVRVLLSRLRFNLLNAKWYVAADNYGNTSKEGGHLPHTGNTDPLILLVRYRVHSVVLGYSPICAGDRLNLYGHVTQLVRVPAS